MRGRVRHVATRYVWIAAVISLASPRALATSGSGAVEIRWVAPSDCPTGSELEAAIRGLLGRAPRVADGRHLEVNAHAQRKPDHRWTATVETRLGTTSGTRTFAAESCRAAADGTALIVALMIDPQAVATHARPPAAPVAGAAVEPPTRMSSATTTAATRAPGPGSSVPLRLLIGPTIAVDMGTLPRAVYGAGGGVGLRLGATTLELGILASATARAAISTTTPPAGGSFRFRSASLSACPTVAMRRLDVGPCAEAELTQVGGTGFGVTSSFANDARWLALGGGLLARLRLASHVAVPVRIDAVAPLARPTFFLRGVPEAQGRVYSPSRVAVRAMIAVDLDF